MYIGKGKRVYLFNNSKSYLATSEMPAVYETAGYLQEIPIYLGEDLNIKTSSEYGSPFQSMQEGAVALGQMLQVVGATAEIFDVSKLTSLTAKTAQSKYASYQFWKYSNPISFSFVANFFVGIADIYDAKQEVYLPTLRLQELVLPDEEEREFKIGEITIHSTGLIPPGPTISSFLAEVELGGKSSNNNFSMVIGNMLELDSCVIKSVEATFSKEVNDAGYPIKSTVRFDVSSTTVATTTLLRNSIQSSNEIIQSKIAADLAAEEAQRIIEEREREILTSGIYRGIG